MIRWKSPLFASRSSSVFVVMQLFDFSTSQSSKKKKGKQAFLQKSAEFLLHFERFDSQMLQCQMLHLPLFSFELSNFCSFRFLLQIQETRPDFLSSQEERICQVTSRTNIPCQRERERIPKRSTRSFHFILSFSLSIHFIKEKKRRRVELPWKKALAE